MKKSRLCLCAVGLTLVVSACTAPAPEPTAPPAPTAAFSFTAEAVEPPLMGDAVVLYTPDFMDRDQESLYRRARSLGGMLFVGTGCIDEFPMPDGTKARPLSPDGSMELSGDYVVAYGRFAKWDDFETMMRSVFTPEYYDALVNFAPDTDFFLAGQPKFKCLEDGRTGYIDISRGNDASYSGWWNDEYELVTDTEEVLEFNLIAQYGAWATGEITPKEHRTESFPIRMERTEAGWRVAQFHVPN